MDLSINFTEIKFKIKRLVIFILKLTSYFYTGDKISDFIDSNEKLLLANKKSKKYDTMFRSLELVPYKDEYLYLHPMPPKSFFKKYYIDTYWEIRKDQKVLLKERDLQHYELITKYFPDLKSGKYTILNYGSGYGGISILFIAAGNVVYNLDYYNNDIFSNNYFFIDEFQKINNDIKFDLIYSSHSLEHTESIKETLNNFSKHSHQNTIYFFEVPNCNNHIIKPIIQPPHTYYFNRIFFDSTFCKSDNNEKIYYCITHNDNKVYKNNEGKIIRVLTNRAINISS